MTDPRLLVTPSTVHDMLGGVFAHTYTAPAAFRAGQEDMGAARFPGSPNCLLRRTRHAFVHAQRAQHPDLVLAWDHPLVKAAQALLTADCELANDAEGEWAGSPFDVGAAVDRAYAAATAAYMATKEGAS